MVVRVCFNLLRFSLSHLHFSFYIFSTTTKIARKLLDTNTLKCTTLLFITCSVMFFARIFEPLNKPNNAKGCRNFGFLLLYYTCVCNAAHIGAYVLQASHSDIVVEFGEWRLTKEKTIHQIIAIIMTWVSLFSDKYSNFGTRNSNILSSHDPKCESIRLSLFSNNKFTIFTFCVCCHTSNPIGYLSTIWYFCLRHKTK